MRLDEATLTAYLDNELSEFERQQLEAQLANSPQAQARLLQLHHEAAQVNEALDLLSPTPQTQTSTWLALKRLRPQLHPTVEAKPLPQVEPPSASIWESPSLLSELKNIKAIFRVNRQQALKASILAAVLLALISLLIMSPLFLEFPSTPQPAAPSNDQDQLLLSLAGKIYKIDSDGANLTTLTPGPSDWSATWSPDRQRIVFLSQKERNNALYLMNADGTGLVQLTDEPGIYLPPQWSPDGQKLALTLNRENSSWDLYSLNVDDKRLTRLASTLDSVVGPVWSPDGKQLAFATYHDERYDIYTLEVDSHKLVNLTRSKDASTNWSPVWSPDGRRLAFISNRTGVDNVYIMNSDGTEVTRLTDNPAGARMQAHLSWSSNGDYLSFFLEEKKVADLYLVSLESQAVTRLTNQVGVDILMLDWSPEGRRIGFLTATDREELELHIIDVAQGKTTIIPLPRELRGPGSIDWSSPW